MVVNESMLLRRFSEHRDADAFSEIVKRYADPVYNTCRRILYDEAGAADAAQETFYQLMCNASSIKGSLAGWLHSVATHKAIEAIRRNSSRRSRERRYAFSKSREVNQWKDVSPHIDKELEKLPFQHRDVLVQYFFEGKKMTKIAAIKDTSQPTVSRNLSAAIEELRKRFRKKGIIVSGVVLAALIEHSTLHAAPDVLMTEVGKMSLVGTASGVLSSSAVGTSPVAGSGIGLLQGLSAPTANTSLIALFSTMKAKAVTAIAVAAVGTGGIVTYNFVFNSGEEDIFAEVVTDGTFDEENTTDDILTVHAASNRPIVLNQVSVGGGYGGRAASSDESDGIVINLADPEETIDTFTELLITDNLDRWADCFVSNSQVLAKLNRIMVDPQNNAEQQLQNAFNSIGKPVETMELLETENNLAMKLLYTVHHSFTIEKDHETLNWQEGDQFEINAEVINVDNEWKIENISTTHPILG